MLNTQAINELSAQYIKDAEKGFADYKTAVAKADAAAAKFEEFNRSHPPMTGYELNEMSLRVILVTAALVVLAGWLFS